LSKLITLQQLGCVWSGREIVKREIGERERVRREKYMRNRVDLMCCLV